MNAKKSLSAFMPRKSAPWDPIRNEGNPTRSDCVNKLIKRIKRAEALKERDEPPSQRTLELFEQDVIPGLSGARVLVTHCSGGGDAALRPVDCPRLHSCGDGGPPQSIEMRAADEDTSNSVDCEQGRLRADGQRNEFAVLHSHLFDLYRKLDEMTHEIRSLRRDLESMDKRNHVNFGHNVPQPEVQAVMSTPSTSSAPESHLLASLSRRPKDLFQPWHEYVFGCDGSKPAKDFTASERGADKSKYCRRKAFWDVVSNLVRAGFTSDVAIDEVYAAYGRNTSVTKILAAMSTSTHPYLGV